MMEAPMADDKDTKAPADEPKGKAAEAKAAEEPEVEIAYTDPNDAKAAKEATKRRTSTSGQPFERGTWASLPRYECSYCGHAIAAPSTSAEDREATENTMLDHVFKSHPEYVSQQAGGIS